MRGRIIVLGDSHTYAIKRAIEGRKNRSEAVDIEAYAYSKIKMGTEYGDLTLDAIEALVASLAPQDLLVSSIGGNHDAVLGLVQHSIPFDVMMPGDDDFDSARKVATIPYGQMKAQLEAAQYARDKKKLGHLKSLARCPMIHLAPPPPKEDGSMLLRLRHPGHFFAQAGIAERGVSPSSLRLKLWQIQMSVLSEITAELGIELLPPPRATMTPNGFLHPDYFANDASHANTAYGEMVLGQIEERRSLAVNPSQARP